MRSLRRPPEVRRRKRKAEREGPGPFRSVRARRAILGIATVTGLTVLMSIHFLPDRVSLSIGDRSPSEIRAARSVSYVDSDATERAKAYAVNRVSPVYVEDPTARAQASRTVAVLFGAVRQARATSGGKSPSLSEVRAVFAPSEVTYLLRAPLPTLERLETVARRSVEQAMEGEIRTRTDDLSRARSAYDAAASQSVAAELDTKILKVVGAQALRPNRLDSPRQTAQMRERARKTVGSVTGSLRPGEVILRQGEIFTQLHLDQCKALGLVNPGIDLVTSLSLMALAMAMVAAVAIFTRKSLPALYASPRKLILLAILAIAGVFGLRFFDHMLGIPLSGVQFGYLGMMMVVSAGMLITVLLSGSLAVLVTALLSVLSGLIMNHEVRFCVMTLYSSLVGIYCVSNIRDRVHLLRATAALAAANVALVWVLGGLLGDTFREVVTGSAWAVAAAAFAIAIFWFGVAVLEKPFGILTHVWLLELSASERPLLRKLCLSAPGTYAHSVSVGTLAEAAAGAVGADTLFCRVASLYHDIGKMRRPHCFVENQSAENIHDRLNPSLSALIIAAHVRDGIELADQHRLPSQIKAIIREHHGTSLIRYFYHQALAESGTAPQDPVLEQHFRYDGPRPQTKESGIIMLADSVEAAARCLEKPSQGSIRSLVDSIVHDKLVDGQLDECDLTYKDLQKIRTAFSTNLTAMLHGRMDYPELPQSGGGLIHEAAMKSGEGYADLYPQYATAESAHEPTATGGPERP